MQKSREHMPGEHNASLNAGAAAGAGASAECRRLTANVSGVVQGVFFRAHAKAQAEKLGLKGYVRNLPDGSVEVLAEGPEENLRKLLGWLRRGPASARVGRCKFSFASAKNEFSAFEVMH